MVMEFPEDKRLGLKSAEEISKRLEEFEFDDQLTVEWQRRAKAEYRLQENPDFGNKYETDFMWDNYRNLLLPWFKKAADTFNITTVNCTGGGALHGEGIVGMPFRTWLKKWCGGKSPKSKTKSGTRKRRTKK